MNAQTPISTSKRREPRKRVFFRGVLEVRGVLMACRIRDLSRLGALVEVDDTVWTGYSATLEVPKVGKAAGVIAWTGPGKAGIAFEVPLAMDGLGAIAEDSSQCGTMGPNGQYRWSIKDQGMQKKAQARSRDAVAALRARSTRWDD